MENATRLEPEDLKKLVRRLRKQALEMLREHLGQDTDADAAVSELLNRAGERPQKRKRTTRNLDLTRTDVEEILERLWPRVEDRASTTGEHRYMRMKTGERLEIWTDFSTNRGELV